jgi:hypothetical protein
MPGRQISELGRFAALPVDEFLDLLKDRIILGMTVGVGDSAGVDHFVELFQHSVLRCVDQVGNRLDVGVVEPTAMWSEPGDLALSRQVDDILVDSGRPRDRLRYEEAPWFWMLDT